MNVMDLFSAAVTHMDPKHVLPGGACAWDVFGELPPAPAFEDFFASCFASSRGNMDDGNGGDTAGGGGHVSQGSGEGSVAALSSSLSQEELAEVEVFPFKSPDGPWKTFADMMADWTTASNVCSHRFKLCHSTSAHRSVGYASKLQLESNLVVDYGFFYCSCNIQGSAEYKPHPKSWCPFKVMFKLNKTDGSWMLIKDHPDTTLVHTCSALPNNTVTATGLVLIREEKELTPDEREFIHGQFASSMPPAAIQHNFRNNFRSANRVPHSDLLHAMRKRFSDAVFGLDNQDTVKRLLADLDTFKEKGGIGTYQHDTEFK